MATHAHGTTFSWNGQTVASIRTINGIEITVDMSDVTTHQSADHYKETQPGLIDAGEVTLEGFFNQTDANGQLAMLTDLNSRTSRTGVITFPAVTGTTWTFTGYITGLKIGDAPVDGEIPFTATIKPTGKPTLAVAASNNLSGLTITTATLYPAFAAGTYDYTATSTGASVTVTPTASAGVITVNGSAVTSGAASSAISLGSSGTMTTVTVVVVEANKAPKTYTVRIAKTA